MARKHWAFVSTGVLMAVATCLAVASAASIEPIFGEIAKLSGEARQKRLEEGARKEGAFIYYSISNADLIGAYVKGFTARYPFINGEFYRGSGNQLVVRTMMEHKRAAGRRRHFGGH